LIEVQGAATFKLKGHCLVRSWCEKNSLTGGGLNSL
jgi:hypothetical protein